MPMGGKVLSDDSSPFARKFVESIKSRYMVRGRNAAGRSRWIGGACRWVWKVLSDDSSPFAREFVGSIKSRYLIRGRNAAGRSRWIGGSVGRCYSIQVM